MSLKESDILNLPDAPDFISEPPSYSLIEMIQICEKMLPYWNKIRFAQLVVENTTEVFSLIDPESKEEIIP